MRYDVSKPTAVLVDRLVAGMYTFFGVYCSGARSVALTCCLSSLISQWTGAPMNVGGTQGSVPWLRLYGI